jgi:hypothetical protein
VKAAINDLSVSAILLAILGGIIGITAGLFLGGSDYQIRCKLDYRDR